MLPDVSGLCGRVGERDRAVEGDAGIVMAAELEQQAALERNKKSRSMLRRAVSRAVAAAACSAAIASRIW